MNDEQIRAAVIDGGPEDKVRALLAIADETHKQLHEALRILNFRDRQIGAALDALEDIAAEAGKGGLVAAIAIKKMREIHRESLQESS